MATRILRRILGFVLVPFVSFTVLAQGLSFEIQRGNDASAVEKSIYMPGKFREDEKNGNVEILLLDKELMISINPEKKTYSEMTFKELQTKVKQSRTNMGELMKKRMAEMPPEQRKKMEERMGGVAGQHVEAKVEIIETGKQRTIDGYNCAGYKLMRDGKEIETIWATRDIPNFASIRKDFQRIATLFTSISGRHGAFASLEKVDGFPIERSGPTDVREKISKVQKGTFPASAFDIPPGYTKEKSRFEEDDKQ